MPDLKKQLGCNGPSEADDFGFAIEYEIAGIKIDRCPVALTRDPQVNAILSRYEAFNAGHLPNGRGLNHETSFFNEAMAECGRLKNEVETKSFENVKIPETMST